MPSTKPKLIERYELKKNCIEQEKNHKKEEKIKLLMNKVEEEELKWLLVNELCCVVFVRDC